MRLCSTPSWTPLLLHQYSMTSPTPPPDAIFELTKKYNAAQNALKVNLGQGTYKDENGNPWILPAVQAAKEKIKNSDHEYLPILGLLSFRTLATELIFGASAAAVREKRVCYRIRGHIERFPLLIVVDDDRFLHVRHYQGPARCMLQAKCFTKHSAATQPSTSRIPAGQTTARFLSL